jgi:hypothetical protein
MEGDKYGTYAVAAITDLCWSVFVGSGGLLKPLTSP